MNVSPAPICPLSVHVAAYDERPNAAMFTIWSDDDAGYASGQIVFYVGRARYHIPFSHMVAASYRNTNISPSPILVQFESPIRIDSAFIERLGDSDCSVHDPYVAKELQTGTGTFASGKQHDPWSSILHELAKNATPRSAPVPEEVATPLCPKPYVAATIIRAAEPVTPPEMFWNGSVFITVSIRPDGTLAGWRVDKSSNDVRIDRAAVASVASSTFAAQIYRCERVSGLYQVIINFST